MAAKCKKLIALGAVVLVAGFALAWWLFPFPMAELEHYPAAVVLTDRTGVPLRVRLGPADTDCRPLHQVDPDSWIAKALVAVEDQRFWRHPGVDPLAILRAVSQNLGHARRISGASTLTTQVIRQLEPRPRTLTTKLIEGFRALQLERRLTKPEILEQYLNRVPFGSNLVGIEAASRRYFGKAPRQLSLAEAALLAGLPQSPSRLRPDRFPERARRRQQFVLQRMQACGMITETQRLAALAQPLAVHRVPYPFLAPHFSETVLAWQPPATPGARDATASAAGADGFTRTSTLDAQLQNRVENLVAQHRDEWRQAGVFGASVLLLDVATGEIRVWIGAPEYRDQTHQGQVNGALAPRSPGSALKPFAYALAMEQGLLTPRTVLADVPRKFRDYQPENFDGTFCGLVSAREALILSLNFPVLGVVEEVGQARFYELLRRLGLDTLKRPAEEYGLGLAVGDGEVRLVDLVNAYACLARGGEWRPWRAEAARQDGGTDAVRLLSPATCWLIADMLSGDERAMNATGHRAAVSLPKLAWKTGTSAGFRDAWTLAWNPAYVIGVWLGNPDGRPAAALVGAQLAAPLAWEIAAELYRGKDAPWYVKPAALQPRAVCAVSGLAPGPHCAQTVMDDGIAGVTRNRICPVHRLRLANANGPSQPAQPEVYEVYPPEIAAFLAPLPPGQAQSNAVQAPARTAGDGPHILSPAHGSVFRLLSGTTAGEQCLLLRTATGNGGDPRETLHWFVDDRAAGSIAATAALSWPLTRGRHQFVCTDTRGRSDRVAIRVE